MDNDLYDITNNNRTLVNIDEIYLFDFNLIFYKVNIL